jgi:hypothetical protein
LYREGVGDFGLGRDLRGYDRHPLDARRYEGSISACAPVA